MRLKQAGVAIDGVAVRDTGPAVAQFLRRRGDPYVRIGDDRNGSVQAALGASGVPESYLIDGRGRIVARFAGDIDARDVSSILATISGLR
jgi:cytochrome c biogenesis protein CcmG/thiol:disulfide interchange protein DsbE